MKIKNNWQIIETILIVILLITLGIISILIVIKKNEMTEPTEFANKFTGTIDCIKEMSGEQFYKIYLLDVIDVKEEVVEDRTPFYKVVYLDKDNYEGFKINEKVKNPEYDDSTLTIIYERNDNEDLYINNQNYKEFIQDLEKNYGYKCDDVNS